MKKLLLGSAVAVALLTGCGEEKKESTQATETKQEIKKDETTTQAVAEKTSEQVKENSQKIEEPKETTTTVVQTKEKVIIAPDKVEGEVKEVVGEAAIDATILYATCGSCHGQKAEKSALGKSQVIAGWDKQRIIDSLNGYKNGTYGGVMKNIMTGQVNNKTEAEIDALADLISKM
jgi:cytochrome c553